MCLGATTIPNRRVVTCKWKVKSVRAWVYLGICEETKAIDGNFRGWSVANIGHGVYGVGSNAYILSDHDRLVNFMPAGFMFGIGDVVQMEYQSIERKLIFSKEGVSIEIKLNLKEGSSIK